MIVCTETVLIGRKCDPMEERIKQQYDRWLSQPGMPADLADELNSIAGDEDAITDRFYRELEFGTGGLRGVICTVINTRWKISTHMASSGMMVGGLLSYSFIFQFNPVEWLCFFILLAGMLGSARIIVKQHTLNEVTGGFFVGLFCGITGILFI